eukprot:jgi/Undpi1/5062/HiC_scaffold_19.g08414.m1
MSEGGDMSDAAVAAGTNPLSPDWVRNDLRCTNAGLRGQPKVVSLRSGAELVGDVRNLLFANKAKAQSEDVASPKKPDTRVPSTRADLDRAGGLSSRSESIATNFGDCGTGSTSSSLQVRSFDADSGVCVIRAGRDSHRMIRASLSLLTGSKNSRFSMTVESVAGCDRTLKAATMEAYARGYRRAGFDEEAALALLQRQRQLLDMPPR